MLSWLRKTLCDLLGRPFLDVRFRVNPDGMGEITVDYNYVFVKHVRENFGFTGTQEVVIDKFINMCYFQAIEEERDMEAGPDDDDEMGMTV